jgi:hypothetical protein
VNPPVETTADATFSKDEILELVSTKFLKEQCATVRQENMVLEEFRYPVETNKIKHVRPRDRSRTN